MLAKRMERVKPSPTLAVSARAKEMAAKGIDVVNFSVGEPDFPTPTSVKDAGIRAIQEDFTHYTMAAGIPELREAICEKLLRDNGLAYKPSEVLVSTGAKQSLYNLSVALFEPGDEVLIPSPCWVSYEPQVVLAGANAVLIEAPAETGFRVSPKQIEQAITPKTKAIILNSPSNPTGGVYARQDLEALSAVLKRHGVLVIADEIYEKLVYDGFTFTSFPTVDAHWKEHCVVINGVSKSHAMTGWRIGYAAGPAEIIAAAGKIQGHSTSNPNSIAQKAALEAITGPQDAVETMRRAFEERRNLMLSLMEGIPKVTCSKPQGAFYLFPDWSHYIGRRAGGHQLRTCVDLASYLLEDAHVAVVPGSGFGTTRGFLRFSYASSPERIREGMQRVREAAALVTSSG
ncbi:MAG: pyridoxal phosphate-dependent aminotransferase [Candidatus Eisenbacteria sp.]|nr:pyridoxal phosphate-dependent aminotransferase [Candidatus Eisenbacteria bacterium]